MAFQQRLAAGPSRGLGPAREIVEEILHAPSLIAELIDALQDANPLVTLRAANVLDKVQRKHPTEVTSYGRRILRIASGATDLRTRWNLIEVIGRLPLKGQDRDLAVDLLLEALTSPCGFLRAFALSGLVHHAEDDAALGRRFQTILHNALDDASPAVRTRARKRNVSVVP